MSNTPVAVAAEAAPKSLLARFFGIITSPQATYRSVVAHPKWFGILALTTLVIALCAAFGGPLVSTSANPSGAPPPKSLDAFDPRLRDRIDGVVDGRTGGLANPTPIRDARSGEVLRGN